MSDPNFEKMSIDEIIDWKVELDAKIEHDRDRLRKAEEVLAHKLRVNAVEQALANAGIVLPEGAINIMPPPAVLGVQPGEVG